MLYAVVVIVPEPSGIELAEVQRRFKHPDWKIALPPHITLVPPFDARTDDQAYFHEKLLDATSDLKTFGITTNSIKIFSNKVSTIYLGVKPSKELKRLHALANQALSPFLTKETDYPKNFIPHITLSGDIPRLEAKAYFKRMENLTLKAAFSCCSISLLKKSEDDMKWILVGSIGLN